MATYKKANLPTAGVINELKGYAQTIAAYVGVPYNIIEGVIWQESKFDPTSYRYSQENHMDRSYGLMHIQWDFTPVTGVIRRGKVVQVDHPTDTGHELAKQLGFDPGVMDASWFYDPILNLYFGANLLKQLYRSYRNWTSVMNAYNTGSPDDFSTGYAQKVLTNAAREMRYYGI